MAPARLRNLTHAKRALLLLTCVACGGVVGYAGYALTGSTWWFTAVPAAMAVVWCLVADPNECNASGACALASKRMGADEPMA